MKPNKGFVRQLRVYEERLKRRRLSSEGGAGGSACPAARPAAAAIGPQRPPATRAIGPQLPPQQRGAKRVAPAKAPTVETAPDPNPSPAPGAASGAGAAAASAVTASPRRLRAPPTIGPQLPPPQKRAKRAAAT